MISDYAWLIPVLPAVSAVLTLLFGKKMKGKGAEFGITALALAFALSVLVAVEVFSANVQAVADLEEYHETHAEEGDHAEDADQADEGEHAQDVEAALRARRSSDSPDLTIAIHTGEVFLGKIGHPEYAGLDVLGDTVNTAFLILKWAVAHHPGGVCASAALVDAASLEVAAEARHAATLPLRGELELVRIG